MLYREKYSQQIRKNNHILELTSQPDQVQRILIDLYPVGQGSSIVAAQPRATLGTDADAEKPNTRLEARVADQVADLRVNIVVDL
jgi:hypothetical protein